MSDAEIIERLMSVNDEFRKLKEEHAKLEERLEELQNKRYITTEEEIEIKAIKRKKLELKDKMNEFVVKVKKGELKI